MKTEDKDKIDRMIFDIKFEIIHTEYNLEKLNKIVEDLELMMDGEGLNTNKLTEPIKIKTYKETCDIAPFQVECETEDGRAVFIYSRSNHFYANIGNNMDEAISPDYPLIERWYPVEGMDAAIKETKGFLDFSDAKELTLHIDSANGKRIWK